MEIDLDNNLVDYEDRLFPAVEIKQPRPLLVSQTPITDANLHAAGFGEDCLIDPEYLFQLSWIDSEIANEFCRLYGFRLLTERDWSLHLIDKLLAQLLRRRIYVRNIS